MATPLASLVIALALAAGQETVLAVPYLPQTPALCGGAAAAMVFRYWGDRHAGVEQFAPYVDRKAGGIANDVLIDAIRQRQWTAERITGSIQAIRDRLAANEPVILLLDDRPGRFHYVVAVGADESNVYIHDPTWGPSRRYTNNELARRWRPSGFWGLVVRPGASAPATPAVRSGPAADVRRTGCERLLDEAVDEIGRRGLSSADLVLEDVRIRCPQSAAPIAELAGVRLAQQRLAEAEALAHQAVKKDPSQRYAWDVLASARFIRNDTVGALEAWNRIGKPRLDAIEIEGLTRTRYALVAESLGLPPGGVLTRSAYRAADRRLAELPSSLMTTIRYRPEEDGFATVKVVMVERPARPRGMAQWLGAAARATVDREVRTTIPGWSGQGEAWSVAWRWWQERPRVAMSFAAPRAFGLPGVTRVETSWETQAYRLGDNEPLVRETQLHGAVVFSDWLTADLRYELGASVDTWDRTRRTASIGGEIEQALFRDYVTLTAGSRLWRPISPGAAFQSGSLGAAFRSSAERRGFVHTIDFGFDIASREAPLALWSGAGDGHARAPLLRAHTLLDAGVITGSVFGRRTTHLSAETIRWFEGGSPARIGAAGFIDAVNTAPSMRTQADVGIGLRIALPGADGVIRADYAHGMRDGRDGFSVGWLVTRR